MSVCRYWELNLGSLEGKPELITAEPSSSMSELPVETEEGAESPRATATGGSEPSLMGGRNVMGPLQEQFILLVSDASF